MYNEFVFEDYRYDPARSILSLCYNYPGGPRFEEQLIFEFVPQQLSPAAGEVLDRIFRLICCFRESAIIRRSCQRY